MGLRLNNSVVIRCDSGPVDIPEGAKRVLRPAAPHRELCEVPMPIAWQDTVFYSVAEVAAIFNRDRSTILHDIRAGRLEAVKVRGQWHVRREVIDAQFSPAHLVAPRLRSTRQQEKAARAATERLRAKGYKVKR